MTLRQAQSLFVRLLGLLIHYVYEKGWELTLSDGHVSSKTGHMPNSLHYVRLAQDLNLFINGQWISDGKHSAWLEIGEFWESLHHLCSWGGRFGGDGIKFTGKDSNHFSLNWGGVRSFTLTNTPIQVEEVKEC